MKAQETDHHVIPWQLKSLTWLLSCLHISEYPNVCSMQNVQGYLAVRCWWIRGKYVCSNFSDFYILTPQYFLKLHHATILPAVLNLRGDGQLFTSRIFCSFVLTVWVISISIMVNGGFKFLSPTTGQTDSNDTSANNPISSCKSSRWCSNLSISYPTNLHYHLLTKQWQLACVCQEHRCTEHNSVWDNILFPKNRREFNNNSCIWKIEMAKMLLIYFSLGVIGRKSGKKSCFVTP